MITAFETAARHATGFLRLANDESQYLITRLQSVDMADHWVRSAFDALKNEHPAQYSAWVAAGRPRS